MGGLLISTLFWNRVLEVPEQNMPRVSAHTVWESSFIDPTPEPEISPLYQVIHQQLSSEKILQKRETPSFISHEPQTVLVVAPHPDDEILCCAERVRDHLAAGDEVFFVVITNGDHKEEGARKESQEYGLQRQKESRMAARKLGVPADHVFFLGFPDGYITEIEQKGRARSAFTQLINTMRASLFPGTPYTWNGLQRSLKKVVKKATPDIIYIPDVQDTHLDHAAVGRVFPLVTRNLNITPEWKSYLVHSEHECIAQETNTEKLALIRLFRSQRHDAAHSAFMDQFASCEEQFETPKQSVATK